MRDAREFLARATPFLVVDEARHNLILGLAATLRDRPGLYDDCRHWIVEDDGGRVVGAALQTPPFALVLAQPTAAAAIPAVADALADDGVDLPGVIAAAPEVDDFAAEWEARRDVVRVQTRAQRIYALSAVRPPAGVSGRSGTGSSNGARDGTGG